LYLQGTAASTHAAALHGIFRQLSLLEAAEDNIAAGTDA